MTYINTLYIEFSYNMIEKAKLNVKQFSYCCFTYNNHACTLISSSIAELRLKWDIIRRQLLKKTEEIDEKYGSWSFKQIFYEIAPKYTNITGPLHETHATRCNKH